MLINIFIKYLIVDLISLFFDNFFEIMNCFFLRSMRRIKRVFILNYLFVSNLIMI